MAYGPTERENASPIWIVEPRKMVVGIVGQDHVKPKLPDIPVESDFRSFLPPTNSIKFVQRKAKGLSADQARCSVSEKQERQKSIE